MNLEGIIFDVDGTLIDSNDLHAKAWVEAFEEVEAIERILATLESDA